jgi:CheY-like chemotaxis protein
VRPQAAERDIRLEILFGHWQKPIVIGDRTRLIQTFWNLLTNAVKFSRNGGRVNILCDSDKANATIQIQDYGEGIPAEFLPYVFERFRQADASKTRSHGGLGLGLALVKSFVEGHGGTIEVASDGPGLGATFTVRLSLQNIAIAPSAGSDFALQSGAHAVVHLLIVEDEPDTLEMMNAALRAKGYRTSSCSSAAAALEITATKDFDLIISDIGMPEMDGNELIRRLRDNPRFRDIPAIAVSGYASKKDGDAALAAGFNAHIAKPMDPEELHALVKELILKR